MSNFRHELCQFALHSVLEQDQVKATTEDKIPTITETQNRCRVEVRTATSTSQRRSTIMIYNTHDPANIFGLSTHRRGPEGKEGKRNCTGIKVKAASFPKLPLPQEPLL